MSPITDPIQAGLARGWQVVDGSTLAADRAFDADVVIIGSGAGGGVSAEILTRAGLRVLIVEEGALKSSKDFKMREADAYPQLYQESAARKTRDKAINILQGRTVGGSTTVNWTSSFRTPASTLAVWRTKFGLADYSPEQLAPWFESMEARLGIGPWQAPPNENNAILARGARQLGIATAAIERNVRGCWNLGYCGMGCPTNAKQSMLVTTIPAALDGGAVLLTRVRAERLVFKAGRVEHVQCSALRGDGLAPAGAVVTIRARHVIVAGGAINSPALLLRSGAPAPHGVLGRRTFLHPTVISAALFAQRVDAHAGAPQTIYSDHFLQQGPIDGALGYKLEAPPPAPGADGHHLCRFRRPTMRRPAASSSTSTRCWRCCATASMTTHRAAWCACKRMARRCSTIRSPAPSGTACGAPTCRWPRSSSPPAPCQVKPIHEQAALYTSWAQARQAIGTLDYQPHLARVVSAHVMGGCTMAGDAARGVVAPDGRYRGVANLSVHDGSLFPTSVGANPQLSIYGVTARLASGLASDLARGPKA